MNTLFSLIVIALTFAFSATSARAYISPSEVFGGDITDTSEVSNSSSSPSSLDGAPVNPRRAEVVVENRQQAINSSRAAEAAYQSTIQDPNYKPRVVTPVVVQSVSSSRASTLFSDEALYTKRQQRISESGGPSVVIVTNGNGDSIIDGRTGQVLHSGAPLVTASGPADIVILTSLLIAAVGTLRSVWVRMRRMHPR